MQRRHRPATKGQLLRTCCLQQAHDPRLGRTSVLTSAVGGMAGNAQVQDTWAVLVVPQWQHVPQGPYGGSLGTVWALFRGLYRSWQAADRRLIHQDVAGKRDL